MNREDIIRMAREARVTEVISLSESRLNAIERFARLVAAAAIKDAPDYKMGYADGMAAEREACYELTDSRCQCGWLIKSRCNHD